MSALDGVHGFEDRFCLDADLNFLCVFNGNHGFLQVDEVLLVFVEGAVHDHGEVFAHNGLGDVEDVHVAFCEGVGDGGDDAFVVDAGDGEDDFHGDSLRWWHGFWAG